MIAERTCPKCGAALETGAADGLCLKCLGRLGFAALAPDPEPDRHGALAGVVFGDYELLAEIGRGGMGVVYTARQRSLNRIVAVKMVLHGPLAGPELVQRFRTEAQAAASLHHPNIVAIYEVGQHDGRAFFSMEYIEGQGLADLVRQKPLPARRAATYVRALAEAMHYAHQRGVLHRDLKPSNVLLDPFDQPRVTDFGLAKLLNTDSDLTLTGQALGSPSYMPPEQAAGKRHAASPQADIYSLGAILYHLLTCRPPFQSETLPEVLLQLRDLPPVPPRRLNPAVPADLQTICLKCLQKDPARRYKSAAGLAEDLARFIEGEPILARPVSPIEKLWLWCRRRPVQAALSGTLALVFAFGLAGILWQWHRAQRLAVSEAVQRRLAEAYGAKTRLNLYAADISVASQALQRGDYGLARRVLGALQPAHAETDLRGFEWRYLWHLCRGSQLATLNGHTWIVTDVAFSPDGSLLASASQDGSARIWDTTRQQAVTNLNVSDAGVWTVGFSPDGGTLLTAGVGGVTLWQTGTWQRVTNFPGQLAALSHSGSLLAVSDSSPFYWERAGNVSLWDYRLGQKLREFAQPGRSLALSPDGHTLAAASAATGVLLWDVASGKRLRELATEEPVWSLTFSPDGRELVATGWSNAALLWDLDTAQPPRRLSHPLTVWSAAFSPDGSRILTASSDQTMRSWDAVTALPGQVFRGHESEVWSVAFSPDGKLLASGGKDQTIRLWSTEPSLRPDRLPQVRDTRPVFSPDGKQVALSVPDSAGGPRAELWDLERRVSLTQLTNGEALGFSADGTCLLHLFEHNGTLVRWSLKDSDQTAIPLSNLPPGPVNFVQAGLSPEADVLFGIDQLGWIRLWDTRNGTLLASFRGPAPPIRAAVLGPGSRQLALSLERENPVHLFDTRTGRDVPLVGHRDFVSGLAFSPDGSLLASGSMDSSIRLWDTAAGKVQAILLGHMQEVTDVAFSPDGQTLASVGRKDSLKLWHLATRRELVSLEFPQAGPILRFSPDGRYLAVTTEADTLRLFEAPY